MMRWIQESWLGRWSLGRARRAVEDGAYQEALVSLDRHAALGEASLEVTWLRAECLLHLAQPMAALAVLGEIQDVGETRKLAWYRAIVYLAMGKGAEALAELALLGDEPEPDRTLVSLACQQARLIAGELPLPAWPDAPDWSDALLARRGLCQAAELWRAGRSADALKALPYPDLACSGDRAWIRQIRKL